MYLSFLNSFWAFCSRYMLRKNFQTIHGIKNSFIRVENLLTYLILTWEILKLPNDVRNYEPWICKFRPIIEIVGFDSTPLIYIHYKYSRGTRPCSPHPINNISKWFIPVGGGTRSATGLNFMLIPIVSIQRTAYRYSRNVNKYYPLVFAIHAH